MWLQVSNRHLDPIRGLRKKAHDLGSAFKLVSRDLELVTIGIKKIDGLRDFVILEFEFDSALFEFALRGEKIFPVCAKGEMKHPKFAVT